MSWVAAAVAGGALIGGAVSAYGSSKQAGAVQDMSEAQLQEQEAERARALQYAQPNSSDLMAMQGQLMSMQNAGQIQQATMQRDMATAGVTQDQLNALMKSGAMSGQNSPLSLAAMSSYGDLMGTQSNAMQAQLARNYGPGWGGSTAGQQAMQSWGQNAALQGAQLNAGLNAQGAQIAQGQFGQLAGLQGQMQNQMIGANQNAMNQNNSLFGMSNALQGRQIAASEGTSVTPFAGASNISSMMGGQTLANIGGSISGVGGAAGGMINQNNLMNQFQNMLNGMNGGGAGLSAGQAGALNSGSFSNSLTMPNLGSMGTQSSYTPYENPYYSQTAWNNVSGSGSALAGGGGYGGA